MLIMPQHLIDITGHRFGRLLVIRRGENRQKKPAWLCRCDCGNEVEVRGSSLRRYKSTNSCGCISKSQGGASKGPEAITYSSWISAVRRCHNPTDKDYPRYGAKGIKMCDAWKDSFNNFLAYIGPRPSVSHTLDRINRHGDYEPGNVRWATITTQNRNRGFIKLDMEKVRSIRFLASCGDRLDSLAKAYGVHLVTIRRIVNNKIWKEESP